MDQRPLRLGDILDDYCPRERRVTNHAIVAMVEDDIKQTRCSTCDTEHVYKGGGAPRRKKAETTGKLYREVLAGLTDPKSASHTEVESTEFDPVDLDDVVDVETSDAPPAIPHRVAASALADDAADDLTDGDEPDDDEPQPVVDEGPVHRQLIRAQLPRIEGVKLERQAPDFTIRQPQSRHGFHRGGQSNGSGNGNGNGSSSSSAQGRFGRGPQRGGGGRGAQQGQGQGQGQSRGQGKRRGR